VSADTKKLISQLKELNENIDILTKVTAISIAKEEIFNGKTEKIDKIKALEGYDLPDRIIALVIGSTPDSVKTLRSKKKGVVKVNNKVAQQGAIQ
jgi:hypothetical protein